MNRREMERPARLHAKVAAIAPIEGITIGHANDTTTWRVAFKPEATPTHRAAAQALIDAWSDAVELPEPTAIDRRAARYKAEADPLLTATVGYSLELEVETDATKRTAIESKRAKARDDYLATKRKIRLEIPD